MLPDDEGCDFTIVRPERAGVREGVRDGLETREVFTRPEVLELRGLSP